MAATRLIHLDSDLDASRAAHTHTHTYVLMHECTHTHIIHILLIKCTDTARNKKQTLAMGGKNGIKIK